MAQTLAKQRLNVIAIHSWDDAALCRRMEELLRAADPELAHYTILPERALDGSVEHVKADILGRLRMASAVLVINTRGLHRRPMVDFEMRAAVELRKRIVVVQPPGEFEQPIPKAIDGTLYRVATWRSDVVGRAIRGEYPQDTRIFDIAETADRRKLVGILTAGIAFASFVVVVNTMQALRHLQNELQAAGSDVQ